MSRNKTFLIAYDVADSKRLRKVFRIVSDYAIPVQFSVFEASLSTREFQALMEELSAVVDAQFDSIRCYKLSPGALCMALGQVRGGDAILV